MRDVARAAVFGWTTPLLAARDSADAAAWTRPPAAFPSPSTSEARALRTDVRTALMIALFRTVRF